MFQQYSQCSLLQHFYNLNKCDYGIFENNMLGFTLLSLFLFRPSESYTDNTCFTMDYYVQRFYLTDYYLTPYQDHLKWCFHTKNVHFSLDTKWTLFLFFLFFSFDVVCIHIGFFCKWTIIHKQSHAGDSHHSQWTEITGEEQSTDPARKIILFIQFQHHFKLQEQHIQLQFHDNILLILGQRRQMHATTHRRWDALRALTHDSLFVAQY